MRMLQVYGRFTAAVLLTGATVFLSGCDTNKLSRTFGFTRDAPDEFTVTTRAPLSMPPDFALRPPRPGAPRPQEQSEARQAEEALVPQIALGTPQAGMSAGQQALVQQAGPSAPADIRQELAQDRRSEQANQGLVDRLLFWRKPDNQAVLVDPKREAQRLRENAALGQSPESGDTPIIQPRRKGWLEGIF
jgi:hypothetical protein